MAHNRRTGKRSFARMERVSSSSGDDVPLPRPRYPAPKRRRVVASPDDEYIPNESTSDSIPDADNISSSFESDFPEDDESDDDSVDTQATAVPTVYSRNTTASRQPQTDGDDSDSESSSSEEEVLVLPEIPGPEEELDPEELEYLAAYLVRQGHATAEDALESAQSMVEESLEFEKRVMEERRRIMEARADRIMEDVEYGDYSSGSSAEESSASEEFYEE